jgi:beta-carotene 3-hydroxylase
MADAVGALVAALAMEPVSYAAHRWLMHGPGRRLHRSHHAARVGRWEANDTFPLVFASVTVLAMAAGVNVGSLHPVAVAAAGVSLYGVAYLAVHDGYIHGRLGHWPTIGPLEGLRRSHALHHRFGGEPYGMLLPVVPGAVRRRAAETATAAS